MEVDDDIATNSVYHAAPSNIPSLPLVLLCSLVVVTKCYIWVSCCNRHLLCMCSYFTLSLYSQFVCNVSEAIYILSVWNFTIVYVLIKVHVTFTIKPVYNSNDGTICSIYGVFIDRRCRDHSLLGSGTVAIIERWLPLTMNTACISVKFKQGSIQ